MTAATSNPETRFDLAKRFADAFVQWEKAKALEEEARLLHSKATQEREENRNALSAPIHEFHEKTSLDSYFNLLWAVKSLNLISYKVKITWEEYPETLKYQQASYNRMCDLAEKILSDGGVK